MADTPEKSVEQKAAEADVEGFRKDLGPFVVAAETTRMAMVFTDAMAPGDPIIFANESFLALTGYSRDEVLGQCFNFLMKQLTGPEGLAQIEAELQSDIDCASENHCRRRDGSEFWAATFISPVRDEAGVIVQHFASFVDLTKHIQEQAHSKMLIDELNHRVKNTLSTVQSIVWQALRTTSDRDEIRKAIESRLFALSRSHDLLTRDNWAGAGLFDLVTTELEPFGVLGGRKERLVISGDNIVLAPKATLALGIAFHELATNAVKYGAFSNDAGSVHVSWTVAVAPDGARLRLRWEERDGPPATPPSHKGFGSQVLERGLAHELEGKVLLEYLPAGLVCTIDLPGPEGAPDG